MKIVSFASILASFGSASAARVENRPDFIQLKDTKHEFQEGRQAFDISGNPLEKNAGVKSIKDVEVIVSRTEGSCPQGFRPLSQSECAEEYSDLSYDVGNGINAMSGENAMWWVHGCFRNTFRNTFWNAASGGTHGFPVCTPSTTDYNIIEKKPDINIFEKKPDINIFEKKPGLSLFGGMCDPKQCGEWDCERFCFCFKMFPWFDTLFDRVGWSNEYCPADEDTCECNPIEVQPEDLPTNIIDELKRDPLLPIDKLCPIWNPPQLFFDVIKPRIICGDWLPGPEDLQDMINELTHANERMDRILMNKDMKFDATFMEEYHFVAPMLTFLNQLKNTQSLKLAVDMTKTEMSQHLHEIPQSERDFI